MTKCLFLVSLCVFGSLACETDSDCFHSNSCIENKCQCSSLYAGDDCGERPQMGLWVAYRVFGTVGHFNVMLFALYQLRRLYLSKSGLTTNMVTIELSALSVASLRKSYNLHYL